MMYCHDKTVPLEGHLPVQAASWPSAASLPSLLLHGSVPEPQGNKHHIVLLSLPNLRFRLCLFMVNPDRYRSQYSVQTHWLVDTHIHLHHDGGWTHEVRFTCQLVHSIHYPWWNNTIHHIQFLLLLCVNTNKQAPLPLHCCSDVYILPWQTNDRLRAQYSANSLAL